MDLQRMKFAFARGARLQVQIKPDFDRGDAWSSVQDCPRSVSGMNLYRYNWRVHPGDARLEYGPLSSALRNRVLFPDYQTLHWNTPALAAANTSFHYEIGKDYGGSVDDDYHMAMLLYAELLADEGL